MEYKMTIAGLERSLPLCPITPDLYIGAFIILGDQALTEACARELLKKAPEYDYIISAEAKGIPIAHEMARQHGDETYILIRKSKKLYMPNPVEVKVNSITTEQIQTMVLDQADLDLMKGKRILMVDDVVSTGASFASMEQLVNMAGGTVVGRMAILAEGKACKRDDVRFLEYLPLFNADGTEKGLD